MLCHVDRPRGWFEARLGSNEPKPAEFESEQSAPWAVERALSGNAAVRAIVVDAMTSEEALTTAGRRAFDLVEPELSMDEYTAIRHMVRRAKGRLQSKVEARAPAAFVALHPEWRRQLMTKRDQTQVVVSE